MSLSSTPLFSILTPVYNPPIDALDAAIASVQAQTCTDWELILVDDCSTDPAVRVALNRAHAADPRITVLYRSENGGICASSQQALEHARGRFVALLDHDDALAARALELVAAAIAQADDVDFVYTDEDKLDPAGRSYDVFAKPDWSPERLRSQMYTGHLSVIRTELARSVGGFRSGFEGSQDYDLVLRVTEQARTISHVPQVLYHWRAVPGSTADDANAKPYTADAARRAIEEHLHRTGIDATATRGSVVGTYRVNRRLRPERTVSIVIPTRGGSGIVWGRERCFVVEAVRSALAMTEHENLEIVVVADTVTPPEVLQQLEELAGSQLVVVPYSEPFNFSRKCNVGYVAARGEYIVFLNDDVEVVTPGWLEALVTPLEESDVGLVGAKLLYSDGHVQHGGHLYHEHQYTHAYHWAEADSVAGFSALQIDREVSGVTAACVAIRREVFEEIGGFCELLPGNFNDVDFCFKVSNARYRMLYLAQVVLFHFESRSRVPRVFPWEQRTVIGRWGSPEIDPYLPNRTGRAAVLSPSGRVRIR
jgi:glycosyltransferase involved in cell wall biosynthesis